MAFTIGKDGVAEIYKTNTNAKAKPFYINLDNPDEDSSVFATTLGGEYTKFTKQTEGKLKFVRNTGSKVDYKSGGSGQSCRFHVSAGKNNGKVGKYSWKDKPLPQYVTATDTCYYSSEFTVIARVGPVYGESHQSFAFKMNSRPDKPDETQRSTFEACMSNDQKKLAYVNYNYAHDTYSSASGVKDYLPNVRITVGYWIGVKMVFLIAPDRKSTLVQLWINTDPIDLATGLPKNDKWALKAEYLAKGITQYSNIPPVWGGDGYLRVDGYKYVDLYRLSQREIINEKTDTNTPAPNPVPGPEPEIFEPYNIIDA